MVIYFGFLKFSILTKLQVFDGQYCSGRLRVSSGGCNQKLRFLNLFDSPLTDSSPDTTNTTKNGATGNMQYVPRHNLSESLIKTLIKPQTNDEGTQNDDRWRYFYVTPFFMMT